MSGAKHKRAAIFLLVGDVDGGGGIERFYINFIRLNTNPANWDVDIITNQQSGQNIRNLFPDFPEHKLKTFPLLQNRFWNKIARWSIGRIIRRNKYDVVHIANFDRYYQPLYDFIATKTCMTLNIIDCRFAPELAHERYKSFKAFLASPALSGIFSWYENAATPVGMLNPRLAFKAASVCFTDYERFIPASKEKVIVFAARLSLFKRPDHYLQAIARCLKDHPEIFADWKFLLWGDGDMREAIATAIAELNLESFVKTGFSKDMSEVFNTSSVFVSTQMYENFTSLSMLEAMASGNAIVSYNVGQTGFFVKQGKNGTLATEETPEALAQALFETVRTSDQLEMYQKNSRKLAMEMHNIGNFSAELFSFWNKVQQTVKS